MAQHIQVRPSNCRALDWTTVELSSRDRLSAPGEGRGGETETGELPTNRSLILEKKNDYKMFIF